MEIPSGRLSGDIIIQHAGPNRWQVSNVFTRSHIGIDQVGLRWLDALACYQKPVGKKAKVWSITYFSNESGLLSDPTRLIRDPKNWSKSDLLSPAEFEQRCVDLTILIPDKETYIERFSQKLNLLDKHHFGNFHQQLGQHLITKKKQRPAEWWPKQKFSENCDSIRPGPYRDIEEAYLDKYFPERLIPGSKVLDLGCGTGYFTRKIAQHGCEVTGLDPSDEYIELAKKGKKTEASFEVAPLGKRFCLLQVPTSSVDVVFISDALLFYFVSPTGPEPENINFLMEEIYRVLKPDGLFINIESHFQFWLSPWYGDEHHPFTILTEYSRRNFYVTPTLSEYIKTIVKFGFTLCWMDEPQPSPELASTSSRAFHFSMEFPLWQIFEFTKK